MKRKYRQLHKADDLIYFNARVEQTDLNIGANKRLYKQAISAIKDQRVIIEKHICEYPEFLTALKPTKCSINAPGLIKKMCYAAEEAKVGPMASVAGAVAEAVGRSLLQFSKEVIVENGGDIFISSKKNRTIGIYAAESKFSGKVGLRIKATDMPLGVCTSSGRIGHSLSYGKANAAVAISEDTALADATATAIGNIVKNEMDIEKAISFAKSIPGILGSLIIVSDKIGAWGNVELVRIN